MSVAQLDSLTGKIRELDDLKKHQQESEVFHTRAQQIKNALGPLQSYLMVLQEFERRKIAVQLDRQMIRRLYRQTQAIRQQYQTSRASIIEGDAQFWTPLKRFAETDLRQALMNAWATHIDGSLAAIPRPLLDLLKQIGSYHMVIAALDECITAMNQLKSKLPQGEDDFARLESLTAQIHDVMGRLPLNDFSPEVQQFLQAVIAGTASFAQLTDDVLDWIRAHHIEESLHVTFFATGGERRYAPR
jgi:hypothetical protein